MAATDALRDALALTERWPAGFVAAGVVDAAGARTTTGERARAVPLASVTKALVAVAALVAVEEGSIALDEAVERVPGDGATSGATVRHLLAHTAGLPFEGHEPIGRPGARRVYSNTGFERLAAHVGARTAIPMPAYLREALFRPLGMGRAALEDDASAAKDAVAGLDDILTVAVELLAPTLIAQETLAEATSVQFPGLAGVVPGIGRFDPCDWGLGFELRSAKEPHWTPPSASPRTFGHFGGTGTFLWVDPDAGVACAALTTTGFGRWALADWPAFGDAVLAAVRSS
ncbi:MAG: serine hydrolase domain-containing protein [Acidimicrobiales bacterium]